MLPQRPDITVRLPHHIRPGEEFEALITLDSSKEQALTALNVTLIGHETTWDRYNSNRAHRETLVSKIAEFGKRTLKVGTNEFRCTFALKPNSPPSYHSQYYQIQYELEVHAAISWWPDAKESFLVKVQVQEQNLIGKPQIVSTAKAITGKDPYIEASLTSNVMHLGGYCVGAVSLGNTAFNKYQKLAVGLVGIHRYQHANADREELHHRYTEIQLGTPEEGKSYPFRFQVPRDLMPSFKGKLSGLEWLFEVRATVSRWRNDSVMHIPVALSPDLQRPAAPPREAPPTVGSVRLQNLWQRVAQRFSLQFQDEQISGADISGAQLSITREQRPDGLYLIGRLSYPSLQLRLQIQPTSGLGRLFAQSIPLEGADWSKPYRINGREPEQIQAFLHNFREQLDALDEIQMSDELLCVATKDSGHNDEPLIKFVQKLLVLAKTIRAEREQIPPPKDMKDGLADWMQLADSLAGKVETSRMAIFGTLDSTPCELITHWPTDAAPYTELRLQVQNPQNTHQTIDLPNKTASSLSRDASELIAQLPTTAQQLKIEAEHLSLIFPQLFLSPLALRADLDLLLQLSISLRSGTGPYR